jgi:hypothetical protein
LLLTLLLFLLLLLRVLSNIVTDDTEGIMEVSPKGAASSGRDRATVATEGREAAASITQGGAGGGTKELSPSGWEDASCRAVLERDEEEDEDEDTG